MLCNHIDVISAQKNPIEEPTQKNYSNDNFIAQQFYNLITSPEFLKNPKKFENSKIVCFNCNHITTADTLWAYGMAYGKKELIQELLSIFNNGSTQDLALFTLKTYTELQKKCLNCFQYSGYYIPEQSVPQD